MSINTLTKLFEKYSKIEIPIIQRDYAQGRQDALTCQIRKNLLNDMKAALLKVIAPLELNFIYGKNDDSVFIPIDGQQRLTTLFLLYLFAYKDDTSIDHLLKKFTYETRSSSRHFISKIIQNKQKIFSSTLKPSEEISEAEWFLSTWKYDPTIKSMFIMMDSMKEEFSKLGNMKKLLDEELVVFKFLNMDDLGMEDSLYIKLNARGKPLSIFENFKARLIGRLNDLKLEFAREFATNFDGKWSDLFWNFGKKNYDNNFMQFFSVFLYNYNKINTMHGWDIGFDFKCLDENILRIVFYTLNAISDINNESLHNILINAVKKDATYYHRALFHAITIYFNSTNGSYNDSIVQWIRVSTNLVMNTQIDSTLTFSRAINGFNSLSAGVNDILLYLANGDPINGFDTEQVAEERLKANIIIKDAEFANKIYKAESHKYFGGQIKSALNYININNLNINNLNEASNIFSMMWEKVAILFIDQKPKNGNLLRRALLALGDYTQPVSQFKTFCTDDPNENKHNPSLKRLFGIKNQPQVTELLHKIDIHSGKEIDKQLHEIINASTINEDDWRYCFIKYPELFKEMSDSYLRIRFLNNRMIIVPNSSSTGYKVDLLLKTIQIKLKKTNINTEYLQELGGNSIDKLRIEDKFDIISSNKEVNVINLKEKHSVKFNGKSFLSNAVEYIIYNINSIYTTV